MKRFGGISGGLERYGLVVLLIVVFIFFTINPSTPQFSTSANIKSVLSAESLTAIIALASIFPLVGGQFDLSLGPLAGLCSLACAGIMSKNGLPLGVAVIGAVLIGWFVGTINGFIVTKVKVNSIVTTLGMTSIISALVQWYTGGESIIEGINPSLTDIGTAEWAGIPAPVYFLVGVAIFSWYILGHTPWGRSLQGVGANPRAAEIVGLPVDRLIWQSFMVGGLLSGVAGVLLLAVSGSGAPGVGPGYLLPALAAALLGATTIQPGRFNVLGTLVAVYFLAATVSGLTFWGAQPWVKDMFNGVALIVAVGVSVWSGLRRQAGAGAGGGQALDDQGKPVEPEGTPTATPAKDVLGTTPASTA